MLHPIPGHCMSSGASTPSRGRIEARLALVEWLHDDGPLREELRARLRALPEIGRALGRIAIGRGSPRDLGQLRDGLDGGRALREKIDPEVWDATAEEALLVAKGELAKHQAVES